MTDDFIQRLNQIAYGPDTTLATAEDFMVEVAQLPDLEFFVAVGHLVHGAHQKLFLQFVTDDLLARMKAIHQAEQGGLSHDVQALTQRIKAARQKGHAR